MYDIQHLANLADEEALSLFLVDKTAELREVGISLYSEVISDIIRCIYDMRQGRDVEYDEVSDFLLSKENSTLTCRVEFCEITFSRSVGSAGIKLEYLSFSYMNPYKKAFWAN